MENTRVILAGIWIALMLTYLLGDVLRIFAGDFEPGKIAGTTATPMMWMGIAILMLIPIVLILLTLTLPFSAARWTNLIAAVFLVVFNLAGLPYKGAYDNFLIGVGIAFNGLAFWYAWGWEG